MKKKQKAKTKEEKEAEAVEAKAAEEATAELKTRNVYDLEADPALQADGAVVDEKGFLLRSYYKRFVEAFKDKERSCIELATGSVNRRPGMRTGEEWPDGIRMWDDTKTHGTKPRKFYNGKTKKMQEAEWGAGWIADSFTRTERKATIARWYNVKCWGTWRLAFVLARLQRQVWYNKEVAEGRTPASSSGDGANATPKKRKSQSEGLGASAKKAEPMGPRRRRGGVKEQPTMLSFFKRVEKEPAPAAPQPTISSFFKAKTPKKTDEIN